MLFVGSESKRLSKILKKESKVEKQTLAVKMSELEELIKLQKDAVKVRPFLLTSTIHILT